MPQFLDVAKAWIPKEVREPKAISRTLGNDELELKFEITNGEQGIEDAQNIIALLERFDVHRGQIRRELHAVFGNEDDRHAYHLIFRPDSAKTHMKKKSHGTSVLSPSGLPLLLRSEEHTKHSGDDTKKWAYADNLTSMLMKTTPIGRFEKNAVDLEFSVDDLAFALTVSSATNMHPVFPSTIRQAEFEFLGHLHGKFPPRRRILETFDRIAEPLSPALRATASTRTKLDWLLSSRMPHARVASPVIAADRIEELVS